MNLNGYNNDIYIENGPWIERPKSYGPMSLEVDSSYSLDISNAGGVV